MRESEAGRAQGVARLTSEAVDNAWRRPRFENSQMKRFIWLLFVAGIIANSADLCVNIWRIYVPVPVYPVWTPEWNVSPPPLPESQISPVPPDDGFHVSDPDDPGDEDDGGMNLRYLAANTVAESPRS